MGEQCRTKVKKLHQEYKKIKDKRNLTGRGRTEWKLFSKLDEILGAQPTTGPPCFARNTDPQPILSDHNSNKADVEEVQETSEQDHSIVADDVSDNPNGSGNSTVSVSATPPSCHDSSGSSAKEYSDEDSITDKVGIKGKKKKQSKGED